MAAHRRRAQLTEQEEITILPAEPVQENPADSAAQEHAQTDAPRRRRPVQSVTPEENAAPAPAGQETAPEIQKADHRERPAAAAKTVPAGRVKAVSKKTGKQKKGGSGAMGRNLRNAQMTALLLLSAAGEVLALLARRISAQASSLWRRIRSRGIPVRSVAMCVLACIALFSAFQIGSIVLRSVRTKRLNDSLTQMREQAAADETAAEQVMIMPDDADIAADEEQASARSEDQNEAPAVQNVPQTTPAPSAGAAQNAAADVVKTTKYRQLGGDALPQMAALYEKNRDLIAWVQIPDVLDLPVVYRNNTYYLKRDFNRQDNASGTIFLDENHPFRERTQNLLLHGHNMKDGTMFGRLTQYLSDRTYIRNHPFINFDTLWKEEQYVIFAVLNVSLDVRDPRFFNYFTHSTFASDAEFAAYIRQLQLRSSIAIPVDVVPSDALLTLSTCLEDDRLVIVARRLRPGETRSELRQLINMATIQ